MIKTLLRLACLLASALLFNGAVQAQAGSFYLKNGDRVVFYGDSITEQSLYTSFVETYVVTRFPHLSVSFINSGWAGDWVVGGGGGKSEERLRRDVLAHKPTVMTVMFGMNDGCYEGFDPKCFDVYTEGYERLIASVKSELPRLRLTLLQPSPFDDFTDGNAWRLAPPIEGGYNVVMIRYGQFVKELARKHRLALADMNAPVVAVINKAQATSPDLAQKIIPDRIHPSAAGGLLMASALLKAWNAPATVTAVELDAAGQRVVRSENTKVGELKTGERLSWTQVDDALPLPLDTQDKALALVLQLSDVLDSLDRQTLMVKNLSAPRYVLKIDAAEVGTWTRENLANGVNLAALPTPMLRQARAVHALTLQHNRIHFVRWRELQVPLGQEHLADVPKTLSALDAIEAELVKRQRAAARPKAHRYELIPQR